MQFDFAMEDRCDETHGRNGSNQCSQGGQAGYCEVVDAICSCFGSVDRSRRSHWGGSLRCALRRGVCLGAG